MLAFPGRQRCGAAREGLAQGPRLSLRPQTEEQGAGIRPPASPLQKLRLQIRD